MKTFLARIAGGTAFLVAAGLVYPHSAYLGTYLACMAACITTMYVDEQV